MQQRQLWRSFWKTALVLLVIGAVPGVYLGIRRSSPVLTFAADLVFAQASVFLIWGLIRLLGNMRAFTSFTWGLKSLRRLIANRPMKSSHAKDEYLKYRNERPVHSDVSMLMICGGILMVLALVLTVLAIRMV